MLSYFGGETPSPDLEQNRPNIRNDAKETEMPTDLAKVSDAEKTTILQAIDANTFIASKGQWDFRRGYGPFEFLLRTVPFALLWIYIFANRSKSPEGRADQYWLQQFSLLAIIWVCILHAAAYFPTPPCSVSLLYGSANRGYDYARQNFSHYQWCFVLIAIVVALYPIILFSAVLSRGGDPYMDLTLAERQLKNDWTGTFCFWMRFLLYWAFIIGMIYLLLITSVFLQCRWRLSYPGYWTWVVVRVSRMPLGGILFQEGENYDCGICFQSHYSVTGTDVVRLSCNENHVYHAGCMRSQIVDHSNMHCVLCHQKVDIAPKA